MSRDLVLTLALSVVLAAWVTTHVALTAGLLRHRPRWKGAVAFVGFPFAPYFGFSERIRVRSALWIVFAIAYASLRWAARA